jgi:hypothetical protein
MGRRAAAGGVAASYPRYTRSGIHSHYTREKTVKPDPLGTTETDAPVSGVAPVDARLGSARTTQREG